MVRHFSVIRNVPASTFDQDTDYSTHPTPSSADVANGLERYLRLPSVPELACHGVTFTFTLPIMLPSLSSVMTNAEITRKHTNAFTKIIFR
jgi:hypothetical protein